MSKPQRSRRYVPVIHPSQIPYHCYCGFRGTLDQRPEHRRIHYGKKKEAA